MTWPSEGLRSHKPIGNAMCVMGNVHLHLEVTSWTLKAYADLGSSSRWWTS